MELYYEDHLKLSEFNSTLPKEKDYDPRFLHQRGHSYLLPRIPPGQTEAAVLEAIFNTAKEHMKELVFSSPKDFLQQFSGQIKTLKKELRNLFVKPIAHRTHIYLQTIVRSAEEHSGNHRDIFDHFRELMNTYHAHIFPTPDDLNTEVRVISWAELQEIGLIKEQGEFAIVNPAVFGKENIPGKEVKILLDKRAALKGGYARLLARGYLLQQYQNRGERPPITLWRGAQAEYPPADVDAILKQLDPIILSKLGIKPTDAEWDPHLWIGNEPNRVALREYLHRRDVRANGVIFFPTKGLYITAEAAQDLIEGNIRLGLCGYDIFGIYSFYKHGSEFLCPKAMFRLLNPLLGKYEKEQAIYIRHSKFDKIVFEKGQLCPNDLGIYWMALARKVIAKPDAMDRLAQLHNMATQMGATTIPSPLHWWKEIIEKYPDFDLTSKEQTDQDLLPWFGCKVLDYIHRLLKKDFGISEEATGIEGRGRGILRPNDQEIISLLYQKGYNGVPAEVYRVWFQQFIDIQKQQKMS